MDVTEKCSELQMLCLCKEGKKKGIQLPEVILGYLRATDTQTVFVYASYNSW